MRNFILMRGIPGSGKSSFVKLMEDCLAEMIPADDMLVVSADDIHIVNGVYKFDGSKLGEGHAQCFRGALRAIEDMIPIIVVDNTNTTNVEMAPYVAMAQAFRYNVHVVHLSVDVNVAARRNIHGVPAKTIEGMSQRFEVPLQRWGAKLWTFSNPSKADVKSFLMSLSQ